ncbi:MAG: hypothetical protein PVI73_13570 [Syntrophobacterales bacterium]|jgi:hypothetical protein
MTRSHRQAENGLISGYKKAEQLARKKVLTEVSGVGFSAFASRASARQAVFPAAA